MTREVPMPKSLPGRRRFLKALGLALLAPLAGGLAGGARAAPAAAGIRATALPSGMFLVNGWILTAADLEALGIDAA
jgi:hypothetical protein